MFKPSETANPALIHGTGASKVAVYQWTTRDKPGEFAMIDKLTLRVDPEYQRLRVSPDRVRDIAKDWSWMALGTLLVARRVDRSLWVYDGQNRKLAADLREDVTHLPCMVYDVEDRVWEALAFLGCNGHRKNPDAIDKFRALLVGGNRAAHAVTDMVKRSGYVIGVGGNDRSVQCVQALLDAWREDGRLAEQAWELCVELYNPRPVNNFTFRAICHAEQYLRKCGHGSVFEPTFRDALVAAGARAIEERMDEEVRYHKSGTVRVRAEGLVKIMNQRRRQRRIPSILGPKEAAGTGQHAS